MRNRFQSVLAFAAGLLIAGCASAPKERFYTLNAVAPASAPVPSSASAGMMTLSLTGLTLPELYDRPQFVVREAANRVDIKEEHRWAQSLRLEIARVLSADLGAHLPNATLLSTDTRPIPVHGPDYRIGINIEQFDATPGDGVTVLANWTIRGNSSSNSNSSSNNAGVASTYNGRSNVREAVDGPGYDALAAAYSRALGAISSDIATRLNSLPRPSRQSGTTGRN